MHGHRLTYDDIKLRVAERASKHREASGVNAIPTDAGELDSIVRAIADAQRMLLNPYHPTTRRAFQWRWLEQIVSVPIDSSATGRSPAADAHRYLIEAPIMAVPGGSVSFSLASGTGGRMTIRTYRYVHDLVTTDPGGVGTPQCVAFKMGQGARDQVMEMLVYPKPAQAYTVKFLAPVAPKPLLDGAQVGAWPVWIDDLLVALAVKCLFDADREAGSMAQQKAAADVADQMLRAIAHDVASSTDIIPAPDEFLVGAGDSKATVIDAATGAVLV